MICKITHGFSCVGIINYNEDKIEKGEAELLDKNISETNRKEYIKEFNNVVEQNTNVTKQKFTHFIISLPKEDTINNEKFNELATDYVNGMGYENCPKLVYRHHDSDKEHLHIVTTTVDFDGKKVKAFNEQYKSNRLQKELEVKYDLTKLVQNNLLEKKLAEINKAKYSFSTLLFSSKKDPLLIEKINKVADYSILMKTLGAAKNNKKYTNEDLKEKLGADRYKDIMNVFYESKKVDKSKKDDLIEKLQYFSKKSTSKEDYLQKLNANKIYYREHGLKNEITYGKDEFYLSHKQVPKELRYESINNIGLNKVLLSEQKVLLKPTILNILSKSNNLESFKMNLEMNNISVKMAENSGGIYGISFKDSKIENAEFIKGSDIDRNKLTWTTIKYHFDKQQNVGINKEGNKSEKETSFDNKPTNTNLNPLGKALSKIGSVNDDAESIKQKRKAYKKDNEEGQSL